jgi:acetylornithine deacetylase
MHLKVLLPWLIPYFGAGSVGSSTGFQFPQQHPLKQDITKGYNYSDVIASSPLLALHRALCEAESTTGEEDAVGKLLVSYLQAQNFSVYTEKVPEYGSSHKQRFNIIAFPHSPSADDVGRKMPKILLTSHIDTVPPFIPYALSYAESSSSGPFNRSALHISGRGTVDDKACVAAQVEAVLSLLDMDHSIPPSDLALLFVVGEEAIGDGMKLFSNSTLYRDCFSSSLSTVIFGEPTESHLASGHKGIMLVKLRARGKAAHSGYPWLGRSANSMILPALLALDKLGDIPEAEGGLARSEKYGKSTVNVGLIRGGVAANVVPEEAFAEAAIRLAGGTPEGAQALVRLAVSRAAPDVDVSFTQGYGPVGLDADVEGFGEAITVNYGTDVPNLEVRKGVKRYLYGPGSILVAHGKNEGLTVGEMEQAVEDYQKLILYALRTQQS